MKPIHAFWFVAEAAAETIAMSPVLLICFASRSTWLVPIALESAWLMKMLRQAGASESYVTTAIFFAIACLRVGQSADASVAETISAFAPFVIAAWIAGSCDAAVACVPLVSLPCSFNSASAFNAPPDLKLSEVVKYGLPRFFGMTKTLRPVFSDDAAVAVASTITPSRQMNPIDVTCFMKRPFIFRPFVTSNDWGYVRARTMRSWAVARTSRARIRHLLEIGGRVRPKEWRTLGRDGHRDELRGDDFDLVIAPFLDQLGRRTGI